MTVEQLREALAEFPDHWRVHIEPTAGGASRDVAEVVPAADEWLGTVALLRFQRAR